MAKHIPSLNPSLKNSISRSLISSAKHSSLMTIRYHNTYARWCQVAVDDTWIYDNRQLAKLYFTDQEIPMTVVGVEFDYTGKGETES